MKYIPWDRLQLDSSLNLGNRVFKQSVSFSVYRTFKRKVNWTPMIMNNGAIFHNGNNDHIDNFIEPIIKQSKKFEESVSIAMYDLTDGDNSRFETLEEKNRVFTYHPYKNDLQTFLKDFIIFRKKIKEKSKALGLVEPTSRKVLIPIIILDESHVKWLSTNKDFINVFYNFLTESSLERIYPFVIAPSARDFPLGLVKALQWSAFLGSDNSMFCRTELYPDFEDSYYSIRQIVIGTVYIKNATRLTTIHPYEFTPSEYYFKKKKQLEDEDSNYKKFLDMLDDGTRKEGSKA